MQYLNFFIWTARSMTLLKMNLDPQFSYNRLFHNEEKSILTFAPMWTITQQACQILM